MSTKKIHDTTAVAMAFCRRLEEELGPEKFSEMRSRSCRYGPVCVSHEYCDSNVCMMAAFREVIGRDSRPDSDLDAALLDRAWGRARMADFDIRKLEEL